MYDETLLDNATGMYSIISAINIMSNNLLGIALMFTFFIVFMIAGLDSTNLRKHFFIASIATLIIAILEWALKLLPFQLISIPLVMAIGSGLLFFLTRES